MKPAIVSLILLSGCAPQPVTPDQTQLVEDGTTCEARGQAVVVSSKTCQEAADKLADLVRTTPDCKRVFAGSRFQLDCSKAQ